MAVVKEVNDVLELVDVPRLFYDLLLFSGQETPEDVILHPFEVGLTLISVSDTLGLSDQALRDMSLELLDSLGLLEAVFGDKQLAVLDTVGTSELIDRVRGIVMEESIVLSDSPLTDKTLFTSDGLSLSDSLLLDKDLSLTDSVSAADSLLVLKTLMLSDSLGLTDQPLKYWIIFLTDSVSAVDEVLADKILVLTDSLGLIEAPSVDKLLLLSDGISLSETPLADKLNLLMDLTSLSDAIFRHKQFSLSEAVVLSEIIGTPTRVLISVDLVSLIETLGLWKPKVILTQCSLQLPLEYVTGIPYTIPALLVEHDTPGVNGGLLQHMGLDSESLQINGFFKGIYTQNDLSILEQMADEGDPVSVKIYDNAGETFVSAYYFIDLIEWQPDARRPSSEGAVKLLYRINLRRKVI